MESSTERKPLKKLANLWAKQSKNGERMLKGKTMDDFSLPKDTKFFIFKNPHKKQENEADFHLMMSVQECSQNQEKIFSEDRPQDFF